MSIQVFDTEAKKIAFTQKYDFRLESVFEVQDQMGARVAELLKLVSIRPLRGAVIATARTRSRTTN